MDLILIFQMVSATKGAGAPETGNEMYFAKQPATVLQYVDGINTGIKDTNGFGHWNKLWWQCQVMDKKMVGKLKPQLRQQIPNKRGYTTLITENYFLR